MRWGEMNIRDGTKWDVLKWNDITGDFPSNGERAWEEMRLEFFFFSTTMKELANKGNDVSSNDYRA